MKSIFTSRLYIFVITVFLFISCLGINYALADGPLDGKTFSVNISEYGKDGQPRADDLIFNDGKFSSTECAQYGFGDAVYESAKKDGKILFEATTNSDKEGTIEWEGKVDGDNISGNFMWSKQGQDPIFYTYSGSLKK